MTPLWRSLVYVPGHKDKYLSSDKIKLADGFIVDLEDAVPVSEKAAARDNLEKAFDLLGRWNGDLLVRVNSEAGLIEADVHAAVTPRTSALVIPKVSSPDQLADIDSLITVAEIANGVTEGSTGIVVLIESAAGLLDMAAILKSSKRVRAVNLGNEDLCAELRVEPTEENLRLPRQMMAIAACAVGVMPLGLVGRATQFGDVENYEAIASRSRDLGMAGSTCIHPSQIEVLNRVFSPTEGEIAQARALIEASQSFAGSAFAFEGRMIDAPILSRAQQVISHSVKISNKSNS